MKRVVRNLFQCASRLGFGKKVVKKIFIFLIKIYRFSSPSLRLLFPLNFSCIHFPSCSIYMEESIQRFGVVKGFFRGVKRICSCHPFQS